MINDIAIDVASQIGPGTTYDTALSLLREEMQKNNCREKINRNIDVQSMLVHCDPSVNDLKKNLSELKILNGSSRLGPEVITSKFL